MICLGFLLLISGMVIAVVNVWCIAVVDRNPKSIIAIHIFAGVFYTSGFILLAYLLITALYQFLTK